MGNKNSKGKYIKINSQKNINKQPNSFNKQKNIDCAKSMDKEKFLKLIKKNYKINKDFSENDNFIWLVERFNKKFIIKINIQNHIAWNELQILKQLKEHKFNLKLKDFIFYEQKIILIYYYIEGKELYHELKNNYDFIYKNKKTILLNIIKVIKLSHTLKIAHRDLKPENIIIDNNLNVTIIDWGFAFKFNKSNKEFKSCGSLNYASPELFIEPINYKGPDLDVWALGVIIFIIYTKEFPFNDKNLSQISKNIKNSNPNYQLIDDPNIINILKKIFINNVERINIFQLENLILNM